MRGISKYGLLLILLFGLILPGTAQDTAIDLAQQLADTIFDSEAWGEVAPLAEGEQVVLISASDGQTHATVVMGNGVDYQAAVQNALWALHPRWDSPTPPRWVKLDLVADVQLLPGINFAQPLPFERSLQGLALDWDAGLVFLPEELVAHTLVDDDDYLRLDNIADYLPLRDANPTALVPFQEAPTGNVYTFSTRSYFLDGEQIIPLYRGHRLYETVTPEAMLEAAQQAGDYLTEAVYPDGRFVYSYLPKTNRTKDDYNILRHAGTVYAMLELYSVTQDEALLVAAQRALAYLAQVTQECPGQLSGETVRCLIEDDEVKLGGNGLALVALTEYMTVTGDTSHLPLAVGLAEWIYEAQSADGSFIHKVIIPTNTPSDFDSEYYPGEAILGLMRLYGVDGDERWLDTAEKAAQYLITVRDAGIETVDLTHDHWLLYGLNELYRQRHNLLYLNHAMRITQAISLGQNVDPVFVDWLGSYYIPPRSTPAATRSEGLCAAYQLARDYDRPDDAARILETLQLGIRFQLQTQFQPESVLYLTDPQRALGGFHHSLTNFEIRNDYVQHNISSLLCAASVLSELR